MNIIDSNGNVIEIDDLPKAIEQIEQFISCGHNILNHIRFAILFCCLIINIGLVIRYYIGKWRFCRRGAGGLLHYSKYWIAIFSTIIQWVGLLLTNILIISGTLLLLVCIYKYR